MIAIIRIKGEVDLDEDEEATLQRLRLGRRFACVVKKESKELEGMILKIENFVAYGKIDDKTLEELIEKRGKVIRGKKMDIKKIKTEIEKEEIESIKPFFRLHPPRKGIKTKFHFPKGVLGNHHEKINELIRRML